MASAKIIPLRQDATTESVEGGTSRNRISSTVGPQGDQPTAVTARVFSAEEDVSGRNALAPTTVSDLYPEKSATSLEMSSAIQLLTEAQGLADRAYSAVQLQEIMAADDLMLQIHALLPELFACRHLGDGFGTLVLGLHYSIENSDGKPLALEQIGMIRKCVRKLLEQPLISSSAALELFDLLEGAELDPLPHALDPVTDIVAETKDD